MTAYRLADTIKGVGEKHSWVEIDDDTGVMLDRRGHRIQAELMPGAVHDATEIPTYLQGLVNKKMMADEVSRPIPYEYTTGRYTAVDPRDSFEAASVKVGIAAWLPEITTRLSKTTFTMEFRGACTFINDVTDAEAHGGPYSPRLQAAKRILKVMQIDREIDVWTMLSTAANWNANNVVTLTSGFEWNTGVNANPIADIENMITDSDDDITDFWMNRAVSFALIDNEAVRDRMFQFYGAAGAPQKLAEIHRADGNERVSFMLAGFDGIRFNIVNAKRHNATTGLRDTILGDDFIGTVEATPEPTSGEDGNTTVTFRYSGVATGGTGYVERTARLEGRGVFGGSMMYISQGDVPLMVGPTLGGLIKNVLA